MNNKWKWLIGTAVVIIIIVALFGAQSTLLMANRYGMMNGYSNMPMMYNGMMGTGMFFMWLIGFALLVFLVLAIAWLVRELTTPKS